MLLSVLHILILLRSFCGFDVGVFDCFHPTHPLLLFSWFTLYVSETRKIRYFTGAVYSHSKVVKWPSSFGSICKVIEIKIAILDDRRFVSNYHRTWNQKGERTRSSKNLANFSAFKPQKPKVVFQVAYLSTQHWPIGPLKKYKGL